MQVQQVTPELLVGDIGTSGDFYRNAFGLELEVLYSVKGRPQYAQLGDGGIKVFLNRQPDRGILQSGMPPAKLWFVVSSVDTLHARLRRQGFEVQDVEETAYGTKEFMFDDPDGYRIGIQELNN